MPHYFSQPIQIWLKWASSLTCTHLCRETPGTRAQDFDELWSPGNYLLIRVFGFRLTALLMRCVFSASLFFLRVVFTHDVTRRESVEGATVSREKQKTKNNNKKTKGR